MRGDDWEVADLGSGPHRTELRHAASRQAALHQAEPRPRVVIAGLSTRAAAESATRAGYAVTTVDAFGDSDLAQWATRAVSVPRDVGRRYTAMQAARAARDVDADAAVYVGGFENHPGAVRTLARGRLLWGNPARALARVRDPLLLASALRGRGFAVPVVRTVAAPGGAPPHQQDGVEPAGAPHRFAPADGAVSRWLLKRRASGGGHGVTSWTPGTAVGRGSVLQERIAGVPGSIAFVADGETAVPLAMSRQLVGEAVFGAQGFQYCGSILAGAGDAQFEEDAELLEAATALAGAVATEFGLIGVNGVDFVAVGATPFPIEVNPRYSASMELAERAYGLSVFDAHARACGGELVAAAEGCGSTAAAAASCSWGGAPGALPHSASAGAPPGSVAAGASPRFVAAGALPRFVLAEARRGAPAVGKAVVYARRTVRVGDTGRWLDDTTVRDVPHPGEEIAVGRPVCTVFATGPNSAECHAALVRRAQRVYDEIERGGARA